MVAAEFTPAQRAARDADLEAERAFHCDLLARGQGRYFWARFPDDFDKGWTVVRIDDSGGAESIGWECGVDLRTAELGPAIAEPTSQTPVEDLRIPARRAPAGAG